MHSLVYHHDSSSLLVTKVRVSPTMCTTTIDLTECLQLIRILFRSFSSQSLCSAARVPESSSPPMEPTSGPYFDWETMSAAGSDYSQPTTTTWLLATCQDSIEQVAPQHSSHTDDPNSDSPRALASASFGDQSLRPLAPIQFCVVADIDEHDDSSPLVTQTCRPVHLPHPQLILFNKTTTQTTTIHQTRHLHTNRRLCGTHLPERISHRSRTRANASSGD